MPAGPGVFARVLVGRTVAAEGDATLLARAKMNPVRPDLDALSTFHGIGMLNGTDGLDVGTSGGLHTETLAAGYDRRILNVQRPTLNIQLLPEENADRAKGKSGSRGNACGVGATFFTQSNAQIRIQYRVSSIQYGVWGQRITAFLMLAAQIVSAHGFRCRARRRCAVNG